MPAIAEAAASKRGPSRSVMLRVAVKTAEADGVVALELRSPTGGRLPDWAPGAHIDLVLATGDVRQYSLCGDRWDPHSYRVAVLREDAGRGGSAHIHDELEVDAIVGVGGPRNNFHLVPSAKYLFIAGGIGITPILPMLDQAERLGIEWTLLYGGRTRGSMAFTDELSRFGDRVQILPMDEVGMIDLASHLRTVDEDVKVYCCGPEPLLQALADHTEHWPSHLIRTERFAAREQAEPVRSQPFDVELVRSDATVRVGPGTSILEAARRAGVGVLSSCGEGTCGTCETAVLEGTPDHRDSIFDDAERDACDRMFICVSRSCSDRLVLDL